MPPIKAPTMPATLTLAVPNDGVSRVPDNSIVCVGIMVDVIVRPLLVIVDVIVCPLLVIVELSLVAEVSALDFALVDEMLARPIH